ncbi:hypothetical protein AX774_g3819 [Zancudomyces culisetae]|uniref:Uncharacterized protein n=1 Tax=Zancudomyces culisetae TaxID=1213189 RepID=A0A1R1PP15_ZANCU|nr:hypothetical protein AX774_g3819 [Zancudomyces culisetae]|eukprot:OMH82698.1 hypothetical protein AX774_g3819 [Zancudomyces culisetae]
MAFSLFPPHFTPRSPRFRRPRRPPHGLIEPCSFANFASAGVISTLTPIILGRFASGSAASHSAAYQRAVIPLSQFAIEGSYT